MSEANGWSRYEERVLSELRDLKNEVKELRKDMDEKVDTLRAEIHRMEAQQISELKGRVSVLEFKSGVWGAVGGVITLALYIGAQILQGG